MKFNITWNSNGTVSYRQKRLFHFIPEMSDGNSEEDQFITPNPVYWVSLLYSLVNVIKFKHFPFFIHIYKKLNNGLDVTKCWFLWKVSSKIMNWESYNISFGFRI